MWCGGSIEIYPLLRSDLLLVVFVVKCVEPRRIIDIHNRRRPPKNESMNDVPLMNKKISRACTEEDKPWLNESVRKKVSLSHLLLVVWFSPWCILALLEEQPISVLHIQMVQKHATKHPTNPTNMHQNEQQLSKAANHPMSDSNDPQGSQGLHCGPNCCLLSVRNIVIISEMSVNAHDKVALPMQTIILSCEDLKTRFCSVSQLSRRHQLLETSLTFLQRD